MEGYPQEVSQATITGISLDLDVWLFSSWEMVIFRVITFNIKTRDVVSALAIYIIYDFFYYFIKMTYDNKKILIFIY